MQAAKAMNDPAEALRPAVSEQRLSLTLNGNIRYQLKTPYRDGTTHVIFEPLDFTGGPGSQTQSKPDPLPRAVRPQQQAPRAHHAREAGKGSKSSVPDEPPSPAERRAAMTWVQRLKRVFNIDIETCRECGGPVRVIACIEDPLVIKKILAHLKDKAENTVHPSCPQPHRARDRPGSRGRRVLQP